MLYKELLTTELDKQRDDFQRFADSQANDLNDYLNKLKQLNETPFAELARKLADKNAGAIPSISRIAPKLSKSPRFKPVAFR